jgi:hypothetical protein
MDGGNSPEYFGYRLLQRVASIFIRRFSVIAAYQALISFMFAAL